MQDVEIVNTIELEVFCYGREVPFDHPKIYLKIEQDIGHIKCPYCNKQFVLK